MARISATNHKVMRASYFLSLTLAGLAMVSAAVHAIGPGNERHRPSHWAPNHVISLLSNNAAWGNVAYWLRWSGPDSMDYLDEPRHGNGVLEVGWKNHGFDTCGDKPDGALGKGGYPADVKVEVDHTEDDGDAVLWIADLDLLRDDQRANPNKEYLAWWKCKGRGDFSGGNGINPHFQVQIAHWGVVAFPVPTCPNRFQNNKRQLCTVVDATLNYIAPGGVGLTTMPSPHQPTRQVNMDQSWARDWNFESSDAAWGVGNATKKRIAGGANQGRHYLYVQPNRQGANSSWLSQRLLVGNVSNNRRLSIGKRTGTYQFEMATRCPIWSPEWARKNTDHCKVGVWLKTPNDGNWNGGKHAKAFTVPADGKWYYTLADNWEGQAADDEVELHIDTRGYPLDIDGVWVSSGLN